MRWKNAFGVWNKKEIWFDMKIIAGFIIITIAIVFRGEIYDIILKY